ncbi:hypothetical protein [Okeania sp. SIO3B5]|uniref:hypothetical protein n=1 Tax=Okeania sp. SIO3B5 TaxID=2607811 RepID=UPI0025E4322C|nr:hypothetical protein [Okeania sp. SIO3B5]
MKPTKRKTVSWTGEILNNLGGKKVVTGNDGFRLDRDLKVPRGILIMHRGREIFYHIGIYPLSKC